MLDGPLRSTLEAAAISLGRLDGMSSLLTDQTLLTYVYIRKEAVLSSGPSTPSWTATEESGDCW